MKTIVMVLLVACAAFAFYWYEYRPSHIRTECETLAIDKATKEFKESFQKQILDKLNPKGSADRSFNTESKNAYYLSCIRQGGLER
jgi:hypothetical protein